MAKHQAVKLSEIRRVAGLQCTHAEAAAFFGMSRPKWRKLLKEDDRVQKAWDDGVETGKISLRRKQNRLASTNAQMAIHLGKQYLGQIDSKSVELTGAGGGPLESIDLTKLTPNERKELRHILTKSSTDTSPA